MSGGPIAARVTRPASAPAPACTCTIVTQDHAAGNEDLIEQPNDTVADFEYLINTAKHQVQ